MLYDFEITLVNQKKNYRLVMVYIRLLLRSPEGVFVKELGIKPFI